MFLRACTPAQTSAFRSEEHTSELQSRGHLVCRLLLEKKKVTHVKDKHKQTGDHAKKAGVMFAAEPVTVRLEQIINSLALRLALGDDADSLDKCALNVS